MLIGPYPYFLGNWVSSFRECLFDVSIWILYEITPLHHHTVTIIFTPMTFALRNMVVVMKFLNCCGITDIENREYTPAGAAARIVYVDVLIHVRQDNA